MSFALRTALVIAGLALLPLSPARGHEATFGILTRSDRQIGLRADALARASMTGSVAWLRRQSAVLTVAAAPDGESLTITFRDRARLVIVRTSPARAPVLRREVAARQTVGTGTRGRAIVLEPFQDQLDPSSDPGTTDAQILASAGFKVDIVRNGDVTLNVIRNLAQYSVIYMETHAHSLEPDNPNSDATVLTREQYLDQDNDLIKEGSVIPALATSDPTGHLWMGFTGQFIQKYVGMFPPSTILYINGCRITPAGGFDNAVLAKGVGAFIGWDNDVQSSLETLTRAFILNQLAGGDNVAGAVGLAAQNGLGTGSFTDGNTTVVSHLGYVGDGAITIQNALTRTYPPTPTPTSTPAPTPTPLPMSFSVGRAAILNSHGHRPSYVRARNTIVTAVPYTVANLDGTAPLQFQVQYRYRVGTHWRLRHSAEGQQSAADGRQTARFTYRLPARIPAGSTSLKVTVVLRLGDSAHTRSASVVIKG